MCECKYLRRNEGRQAVTITLTSTGLVHRAENHRSPLGARLHQLHPAEEAYFPNVGLYPFHHTKYPLQLSVGSSRILLLALLPGETHAASEFQLTLAWVYIWKNEGITQHQQGKLSPTRENPRSEKPQWPPLLLQDEIWWGWLVIRRHQGAGCVPFLLYLCTFPRTARPSPAGAIQLRFLPFSFFRLEAILAVFFFFFFLQEA